MKLKSWTCGTVCIKQYVQLSYCMKIIYVGHPILSKVIEFEFYYSNNVGISFRVLSNLIPHPNLTNNLPITLKLVQYPGSRLGELARAPTHQQILQLVADYSLQENEYFFDRCRQARRIKTLTLKITPKLRHKCYVQSCNYTVCPISLHPIYKVTYYVKWVKNSWTYDIILNWTKVRFHQHSQAKSCI